VMHPTEMISAYLDGELSRAEVSQLQAHMSSCGRCVADMEALQKVRTSIRSLPLIELPPGLLGDAEPVVVPLRRNRGLWVGAAAAVVAAVIAVAAMLTPQPASLSVNDLNSRFGARVSLDPAFGPAKVAVPDVRKSPE
jgi:anti-sigma factor RsiW